MIIVNRRYILVFVPLVLLLLGLGTTFFLINKKKEQRSIESQEVVLKNTIAVPVDAVAISCFRHISSTGKAFMDSNSIFSGFIDKDNALYKLIRSIEKVSTNIPSLKEAVNSENLISLHYSAKNDISLLFCLDLSHESIDKEIFKKSVEVLYPGSKERSFNKMKISSLNGVQFSIYNNIFIASTSQIVLESSLRHLASGSSILDNKEFFKVLKESVWEDNVLFINNQQIGKLFSGVIDRSFWSYSDFFSKLASWTTLNGVFGSNFQRYKGTFTNYKGVGNYSTGFISEDGESFEVWKILPHNTFAMLTIPLKDYNRFLVMYQEYKELYKKLNSKNSGTYKDWFLSLNPQEVSTALIPFGGGLKWVTFIRTNVKKGDLQIEQFKHKGAVSNLFGEVFSHTQEDVYCKRKDWIIIGSEDIVKEFANGTLTGLTMEEYFKRSDTYSEIIKDETLLSVIVNLTAHKSSVVSFFKPLLKDAVSRFLEKRNFESIVYQVYKTDLGTEMNLLFCAEQIAQELDTLINVPTRPFKLSNYIKNNKGLLLFANRNELYLLDRLERFTKPLPTKVEHLISLGPNYCIQKD